MLHIHFHIASLKCSGTSCTTGSSPDAKKPFCGNAASAEASCGNTVAIGVCGNCQKTATGCGTVIDCQADSTNADGCLTTTSCGSGMVCCTAGQCASGDGTDKSVCTA